MIYSLIYNKVYNFLKQTRDLSPDFSASGIIFVAQAIHFCLLLVIIRCFSDIELPRFSEDGFYNKLGLFPIAIIWLLIIHYYFKKRISKTQTKYGEKVISKIQFVGLIFFAILLPLYLAIKISGGEVWQ